MLEGARILGRFNATAVGSISIALGIVLMSRRVITTVGKGITPLGPLSAFSMQISAAVGMTVCSMLGVPMASSQSIVASALGVGLARGGASGVNQRQVGKIMAFWVIVPLASMMIAYLVLRVGS